MGWFGDLFGGKTKKPKIDVTENPDGSRTVQSEFELSGDPRPVRDEVVVALDDALTALGGEVMHAMDPTRLLDFDQGGPPV